MPILNVKLNPNDMGLGNVLSNGHLTVDISRQSSVRATHGKTSGKWYWEVKLDSGSNTLCIGISNRNFSTSGLSWTNVNWRAYSGGNTRKYPEVSVYGVALGVGNVIGVALDLDVGTLEFYRNGVSMGTSHTNIKELGEVYPTLGSIDATAKRCTISFAKDNFIYNIPSGFKAYNDELIFCSLILHNSSYKHYTSGEWKSLISSPTEQDYLTYGIIDISTIPESAWAELQGEVEICHYTDNPNAEEVQFNIETTPFTLIQEWRDKEIKVIEYTDNPAQTESNITLETEPFTLYDELGDNVDVLYYTDDPSVENPMLEIEANYSPIDEIEGDFDVVTWTDSDEDLTLNMNALPKGQLILSPEDIVQYGELRSFIATKKAEMNDGIVRFILSFNSGVTWEVYDSIDWDWRMVNINDLNSIRKYGMTFDTFNSIPIDKISEKPNGNLRVGYYIEESIRHDQNVGIDSVGLISFVPKEDVKFSDMAFYVLNTLATISIQLQGNKLVGQLDDADAGRVQYRVILNGTPYYPASGEFSPLQPSPLNIQLNLSERDLVFGVDNTLKVEFQDGFGQTDFWETTFIGSYSGIMFKDPTGNFLSNSFGEVLQRLQFGDIIAGQSTLEQKVIVKNQLGVRVQNMILEVQKAKLPPGISIQLSRSNFPFAPEDPLLFNMFFEPDEEFELYVRIVTELTAPTAPSGSFEVRAKADPV